MILWWQKVTVTPEARRTTVFKSGSWKGFKAVTPAGGQIQPSSAVGDNLLWKKAQKKDTKNITSEIMKRIIPSFNPVVTAVVWNPRTVPSRATSRHHWKEQSTKINNANNNKLKVL